MKLFNSSLIAFALASATAVNAASLAITNAKVHTITDAGVLENATVIIDNGVITAINPELVSADQTIDAQGKILTPGFITSINQLGLVEVGAVSRSRDASEKKADITFDASLAFNPKSTAIPFARKAGITRSIVTPQGGDDMFKGQAFVIDLSGGFDSIISSNNAVVIELGAKPEGSRATALQALANKLSKAKKALDKAIKAKDKKDKKTPTQSEKELNALLKGDKPLLAYVDRATDILAVLNLKERFGLHVILLNAADAVLVADQIAAANVPVIMEAMRNLPSSFDSLHTHLGNAGKLNKAGVKVILTVNDTYNAHQLRFSAGNAVSYGMNYDAALASVTSNVAEVFGLNSGQIAVGKAADIVLWSADPFELSAHAEKMWINGEEQVLESRQDKLRDRYMTTSDMPSAYTK